MGASNATYTVHVPFSKFNTATTANGSAGKPCYGITSVATTSTGTAVVKDAWTLTGLTPSCVGLTFDAGNAQEDFFTFPTSIVDINGVAVGTTTYGANTGTAAGIAQSTGRMKVTAAIAALLANPTKQEQMMTKVTNAEKAATNGAESQLADGRTLTLSTAHKANDGSSGALTITNEVASNATYTVHVPFSKFNTATTANGSAGKPC